MKKTSTKSSNNIAIYTQIFTAILLLIGHVSHAQSTADGLWTGIVASNGLEVAIDIEIDVSNEVALLSIPIQGLEDIKSSSLDISNDTITIGYTMFRAEYIGIIDSSNDSIHGEWIQGQSVALDLVRAESKTKFFRPQTPEPPYPYDISEHSIRRDSVDVVLAGTLTLPEGDGPFPLAVTISGSGRQDRNSKILGHEPFWVMSDYLTKAGIAIVRYDDRGVGGSTGNHATATSADLAADASAVLQYAKNLPLIDATKVGFIGHSEGGLIAPMIAADRKDIGFIVSLAGPGVPITELMTQQNVAIYALNGMTSEGLEIAKEQLPIIYDIVIQDKEPRLLFDTLIAAVHGYYDLMPVADQPLLAANKASYYMSLSQVFFSPWFRYFLGHDPSHSWQEVSCPVLAINGDKDIQVDGPQNLKAIESNLTKGGNKNVDIRLMEGLNHLMQPCDICTLGEYATIETTIDPSVLVLIKDFILSL